jgi:hypothetical protein
MQNVPINDADGGQIDNYVPVLTTRCSLEAQSGKSSVAFGKMEYLKYYILKCRFQTAIVIDSDSLWVINNETYVVEDWAREDMIPFLYTFRVIKNQAGSGGL